MHFKNSRNEVEKKRPHTHTNKRKPRFAITEWHSEKASMPRGECAWTQGSEKRLPESAHARSCRPRTDLEFSLSVTKGQMETSAKSIII